MKEYLFLLPIAFFYLILKSTLFPNFPLPDIPLLIVFYLAYRRANVEGVVFSFILGYIEDAFTGGVVGSTSFSLIAIFIAVHLFGKKVHFSTPAMRAGGAALFVLLKGVITYYILRSASLEVRFLFVIIIQAALTGLLAPAVFAFLSKVTAFANPHRFRDNEN